MQISMTFLVISWPGTVWFGDCQYSVSENVLAAKKIWKVDDNWYNITFLETFLLRSPESPAFAIFLFGDLPGRSEDMASYGLSWGDCQSYTL